MRRESRVEPQSVKNLSYNSLKRALDLFSPIHSQLPPPDPDRKKIRMSYKVHAEYDVMKSVSSQHQPATSISNAIVLPGTKRAATPVQTMSIGAKSTATIPLHATSERNLSSAAFMERIPSWWPRPVWHAPWKNYRVISGHLGWVRSITFDPSNKWFYTGSADRTIKMWDVASGTLQLTLTGHIGQVRGLAVSSKCTYLFSAGDDKKVKCWDLAHNKVIRDYHGHVSGVYSLAIHPNDNILFTGGRDSVCRVWDIRTNTQSHALSGHKDTVCSVFTRATDPQVVTGSHDSTIKFWDLRNGKTTSTITHHKKSVRAMAQHPTEDSFASGSSDNIKKFNLPRGEFLHNMLSQQNTIINAMTVNKEGVLVTGGDNGSLWFWDWKSGHSFQQSQTIVQPGSLDCEAGIFALSYDITGSRLVTCEADKTIKMWKQDKNATPETHPVNFKRRP